MKKRKKITARVLWGVGELGRRSFFKDIFSQEGDVFFFIKIGGRYFILSRNKQIIPGVEGLRLVNFGKTIEVALVNFLTKQKITNVIIPPSMPCIVASALLKAFHDVVIDLSTKKMFIALP